jgi:two-component system alkaline phosphatase synthesis response regulator PhoP
MSSPGPHRQHILIVEDDPAIAAGLALNLKLAGHRTSAAEDGLKALSCVQEQDFDMILLDINLPHRNGLEVLQSLRAADNLVPVIVLSARDGEFDKVAALRLGADDYLTKPFALAELLARMEAVLRRAQANPAPPPPAAPAGTFLRFGEVVVDVGSRTVTRGGQPVKLTHLEFELLLFLSATRRTCSGATTCSGRCGVRPPVRHARWTTSSVSCATTWRPTPNTRNTSSPCAVRLPVPALRGIRRPSPRPSPASRARATMDRGHAGRLRSDLRWALISVEPYRDPSPR